MSSIYSGLNKISGDGNSLTPQQENKLNKVKIDGDGTKVLADNGEYVTVSSSNLIDNTNPLSNDTTYSASKIESDFVNNSDLDNAKTDIENSIKTDFFSKQETLDYLNSKLDNKVNKIDGYGLSQNNFSDAYKDTLDTLDLSDIVRDPLYVRTENNFSNIYKQKLDNLTNDSKYIGLFDTKAELDAYNTDLTTGLWGSVLVDETQGNKKTKYIYDGTQFVFAGYYSDDSFLINDSATVSESLGWSSKKLTTEFDKKANQSDVDTSINEIHVKLDKKLEISNIFAGQNIDIDVSDLGLTINSTASGGTSTGGTTDYELLSNKPKINGITVIGDKTAKDLKLLDSSYASEENEGSVKLADKAKEIDIEGQLTGSAQYYGTSNGGTDADNTMKLRPFPVGTSTERIETLDFDILTKDVPQSIPFAREIPDVNCFVQAFKQEESELNITDVFENYSNENVSNYSENVLCNENGLSIKDEYEIHNNGINSDGLYEIKIGDFINIKSIGSEVK